MKKKNKTWKQPKCPLMIDEWIKKMRNIYRPHTVEWILGTEQNEILPFVTTWMDFEGIALSEIRQKDKYSMTSLVCGIQKTNKRTTTKKRQNKKTKPNKNKHLDSDMGVVVTRGGGGEGWVGGEGEGGGREGAMVKGELYGDGQKLNCWWWACCRVYKSRNTTLYLWNLHVINQLLQ